MLPTMAIPTGIPIGCGNGYLKQPMAHPCFFWTMAYPMNHQRILQLFIRRYTYDLLMNHEYPIWQSCARQKSPCFAREIHMFAAEIVAMFGKSMRFSSPIHANPPPRPEAAAWPRKLPQVSFRWTLSSGRRIRSQKSVEKSHLQKAW